MVRQPEIDPICPLELSRASYPTACIYKPCALNPLLRWLRHSVGNDFNLKSPIWKGNAGEQAMRIA
jgi:hypothetical protein